MWFESLLVFILFKFKKCPNISRIPVVINAIFGRICDQFSHSLRPYKLVSVHCVVQIHT